MAHAARSSRTPDPQAADPESFDPDALEVDSDESDIRQLIERLTRAIHDKDAKAVVDCYQLDNCMFTLGPPLRSTPESSSGEAGVQDWLDSFKGPVKIEVTDLEVRVSKLVAFSYSINRLRGTKTDGETHDFWYRETFGFERLDDGTWRIAHQHQSVPFYMDGNQRAALDLKP